MKPKIIFAVNDLLVGGAQRLYLDLFTQGFPEYEIHLLTLFQFPKKQEWYESVPEGVIVHRLTFGSFRDIPEWFRAFWLIASIRPMLVVSSLFFCNTVTRVIAFFLYIPVITIEHNTYTHKTKSQQWVDWLLAKVTYRIVAVSRLVLEFTLTQERLRREKFVLINNGIDLRAIDAAAQGADPALVRDSLGLQKGQKLVLAVGRLTAQKNHRVLIEGFALFAKTHPEYVLAIAGEGSLKEALETLIHAAHAEHCIQLLGARKDIIALYRASEFLVSTSHIEGFPLAHAEALRTGIPVLSTNTGGAEELIVPGKNGLLFVAHTPELVKEALEKMVVTRFLNAAEITASVEKFSIANTARAYRRLIAQALKIQ